MDKKCLIVLVYLSIFILNTSTQTICPKNCITCSSSTICTTCSTGYYKDSTSQCRPCNTGCLSCSSPATGSTIPKCTTCMTGFNLSPTIFDCFTCSSSCLTCSQIATNCTTCPQGTIYKIVNGSGTCYRDPNCLNNACLACRTGSGTLCQSCKSGYFLRKSGQCSTCPYPCVNCQYTIDSASIINNYNLGITYIKDIIALYNSYLIQMVDIMNRYKKYSQVQKLNPTVVFNIFLQDANYSLIPSALDLNFTGPDFTAQLLKASPYFNLLVDESFFNGISYLLYNKIFTYTQRFVTYVQSLANSTNTTNLSNSTTQYMSQFLGFNYTDTDNDGIVDIGNSTDDWRDYFGNYTEYFGNGTQQSVTINNFYTILHSQASFKRYFNGTVDNLKEANNTSYFNFQMAPPNCINCVKGFYFDQTLAVCFSCRANCIDCTSNTTCLLCYEGYYYNSSTSECQPCSSSCLTCSGSPTQCNSCISPAILTTTKQCIRCISPCDTCKQTNVTFCLDCMAPYSLKASTSGICFRCAQDICKLCDSVNNSICIQCSDGYSLINGKCQLCPAKCLQCSTPTATNNYSQCYSCQQRYVLNTTSKRCDQCGPLCLQCKVGYPNICIKCQKGTYLSTTGVCSLCMAACLECTNGQSCTVYKEGVMLFGNQVISCRPGCKKCDSQNPQKCLACEEMFALIIDNCQKCASGCATCKSDNTQICQSCPSNSVLQTGKCTPCPSTCTTCSSGTICTGCIRGFILNVAKSCVDASTICPANCLQCNANKICTECSFGFVISSTGTCVQCVSSCGASCDASNPLVCTGCTVGFQSRQGKCIRCPLYCKKCSGGVCSQCDLGYQLSTINSAIVCSKACIFPCKRCNVTTCFECTSNFTLTSGKCQPDITCGGKGCLFCPTGSFKAESGNCVKCTNNCASCKTQNECLVCRQGYFQQNKTCVPCSQGAQICRDSVTSILCKPGYLLEALNFDNSPGSTATYSSACKPCESPCKQCMFLPGLCISCINDEYRLNGTSCLRKKVVGSEVRFNMNYQQFLKGGKAQQILSALSGSVKGKIIITFMRSGSTVFGMAVSGDGTTSESSIANSLSTAVSSGSLGVPVMSSSVGIFVEDAPFIAPGSATKQSQTNVGLIVGIIVGVVILIIITVVLVFKLRKKPQKYAIKPQSNTELVDLRLRKKKGSSVQYSTLSSFANNSKVLFS